MGNYSTKALMPQNYIHYKHLKKVISSILKKINYQNIQDNNSF